LLGQEWQAESKAAAAAQEKKRVEEAVEARLQISFFPQVQLVFAI